MTSATLDRCRLVLYGTTLEAFLRARPPRAIVSVGEDDVVRDALRLARAANASQVLASDGANARCVSMRDIARAWMEHASHEVEDRWFYTEYRVRDVRSSTSIHTFTRSQVLETTMLDVCSRLARSRSVACVVDASGGAVDVVTASDVVRFLSNKMPIMGEIADAPVASIFKSKSVLSEVISASARRCVGRMIDCDVSALALTDETRPEGEFIGCFSLNDFRRIDSHEDLSAMRSCSVLEFVSRKRVDTFAGESGPSVPFRRHRFDEGTHRYVELVYAKSDTPFEKLLAVFAERGIHHVFVLGIEPNVHRPHGVLTPSDVVAVLAA